MIRTVLAVVVFIASLVVTIATAIAAETAPRNTENVASVDLYKDPG